MTISNLKKINKLRRKTLLSVDEAAIYWESAV